MYLFFFFNDTATTEIYTLSLHDALPICSLPGRREFIELLPSDWAPQPHSEVRSTSCDELADMTEASGAEDRKSTRLNSSHLVISYAVFCLKKKKAIQLSISCVN